MQDVGLRFGQYSSGINIQINSSETTIMNDLSDLDGTTIGGVSFSVTTLPTSRGVQDYMKLDGFITYLKIGGRDLYIDQFCYDFCPPICIVDITFVSNEPVNATEREIVVNVERSDRAVLCIQKSSDIAVTDNWSNLTTTVTTPDPEMPQFQRCVVRVPLSKVRQFFTVQARYN